MSNPTKKVQKLVTKVKKQTAKRDTLSSSEPYGTPKYPSHKIERVEKKIAKTKAEGKEAVRVMKRVNPENPIYQIKGGKALQRKVTRAVKKGKI